MRDEWGDFQTRVWYWLTQGKPDSQQLLKIGFWVAKGPLTNPVVVFHTLCDGVASFCNLAHCHASFGREEYGRVFAGTGPIIESLFFFFGLFVYLHLFMLWAKPLFKKLILTFNILFHIIIFVMNSYLDVNIKIFLFL